MPEIIIKGDKILLDKIDLPLIKNGFCIHYKKGGNKYVGIGHRGTLHQKIMGKREGFEIDHINGNGLDNRRSNLRFCTHSQNIANSKLRSDNKSGVSGVSWCKRRNLWRATTTICGQVFEKGFLSFNEALEFRKQMSTKLFGEFSKFSKF